MKYNHIYIEEARRILDARKDRSAWGRAVTEDAINLLDAVNDACEYTARKYRETEEGGAAHVENMFKSRRALYEAMLIGAQNWTHYSYGGCALVYDSDIAKHYCTPSELKKTRNGDRNPNGRENWLDVQARALSQAASRAVEAITDATRKTYTIG